MELRPCPFCGGNAYHEIIDSQTFVWCRVHCVGCNAEIAAPFEIGMEAIEAWNRRVGEGEKK